VGGRGSWEDGTSRGGQGGRCQGTRWAGRRFRGPRFAARHGGQRSRRPARRGPHRGCGSSSGSKGWTPSSASKRQPTPPEGGYPGAPKQRRRIRPEMTPTYDATESGPPADVRPACHCSRTTLSSWWTWPAPRPAPRPSHQEARRLVVDGQAVVHLPKGTRSSACCLRPPKSADDPAAQARRLCTHASVQGCRNNILLQLTGKKRIHIDESGKIASRARCCCSGVCAILIGLAANWRSSDRSSPPPKPPLGAYATRTSSTYTYTWGTTGPEDLPNSAATASR
jgi:hypothetical protein